MWLARSMGGELAPIEMPSHTRAGWWRGRHLDGGQKGYGVTHRGFSASAVRRVRSCLRTAIEVSLSLWMRPRTSRNSTAAAATATQTGRCEASRGSERR